MRGAEKQIGYSVRYIVKLAVKDTHLHCTPYIAYKAYESNACITGALQTRTQT